MPETVAFATFAPADDSTRIVIVAVPLVRVAAFSTPSMSPMWSVVGGGGGGVVAVTTRDSDATPPALSVTRSVTVYVPALL